MTYEETKLSVIIVNYNVKYFLEQCLYSVRAAVTGMDAEVFVVDNNSTDGSVEYLRPKFPEVVFIENKDNPGFAKANNQAIRQCTGEYVLLLNPDTVVGEESLRSLCFQMRKHRRLRYEQNLGSRRRHPLSEIPDPFRNQRNGSLRIPCHGTRLHRSESK